VRCCRENGIAASPARQGRCRSFFYLEAGEGDVMTIAVSRRRFLERSAIAAGALALPATARRARAAGPVKQVSLLLDWIYQGPNAGFVVAREKGYYRDAGLDVQITAGKGSASTAQLMASKVAQFGFVDGFVLGSGVSKGMPLKSVASLYRRNPCAVMTLEESGIKAPKDLEGKSIAITAGSAQFQQFPAFMKGAGIDASKVRVVNLDPTGVTAALLNNQVPAIAGFFQSYMAQIEIRGKKAARAFWFADSGVSAVSNGIVVHEDFLKSDPELVRAFVPPSIKGFLDARQNPGEAVAMLQKYSSAIEPAIAKREAELSWQTWVTPNTRGKPFGWASDIDWAATVHVLKEYGGVTTPLDAATLFTNEFVPTGAEYVPPQGG
jgi:NitT/TauT family transport system substrate-binding protein